jgi:hypothetical protein
MLHHGRWHQKGNQGNNKFNNGIKDNNCIKRNCCNYELKQWLPSLATMCPNNYLGSHCCNQDCGRTWVSGPGGQDSWGKAPRAASAGAWTQWDCLPGKCLGAKARSGNPILRRVVVKSPGFSCGVQSTEVASPLVGQASWWHSRGWSAPGRLIHDGGSTVTFKPSKGKVKDFESVRVAWEMKPGWQTRWISKQQQRMISSWTLNKRASQY